METFSALLAICAGNSPVPGDFFTQRPVTRSFDVNFDLRPNKRLSKQLWGGGLRRNRTHYDVIVMIFRVTGPMRRASTSHRWIPLKKASDKELWYFLWSAPERHRAYGITSL